MRPFPAAEAGDPDACCDAELGRDGRGGTGDPTELAILAAAAERGIQRGDIERDRPRRSVNPFDSDRKLMSILRADGVLYVKGAIEVVLARSAELRGAGEANAAMSQRGLRVLAVATGAGPDEEGLQLLGLLGHGRARQVREAIEDAQLIRC